MEDKDPRNFIQRLIDKKEREEQKYGKGNAYKIAGYFETLLIGKDKKVVEQGITRSFLQEIGLDTQILNNMHEPPDCIFKIEDKTIGIELTALLHEETRAADEAAKRKRTTRLSWHNWAPVEVVKELTKIIQEKEEKILNKRAELAKACMQDKGRYDETWLLITCGEEGICHASTFPGICHKQKDFWEAINSHTFETRNVINKVYLMLRYDSDIKAHPILELNLVLLSN